MTNQVQNNTTIATETKVEYVCKDLIVTYHTKSGVIRHLGSLGLTRSQILAIMKQEYPNFLYQHVRNVLITPVKKAL